MVETQTAILDALPAHIVLLDKDGTIVAVNEAWRRFGTTNALQNEEFCAGQNYLEVCESATGACAEEAKATAAGLRRVLDGKTKEFVIEYPCHSPDEQRWFRMMATPLKEDGRSVAVVMHVDITERKLAEAEIERTLHRLTEAQQFGKIGDWEWNIADERVNWSPQVFEIFGRDPELGPPEGFEGQFALYKPESRKILGKFLRQAVEAGEPRDYELLGARPSGQRVNVFALRESEERFQTLLQDIPTVAVQSYGMDGTTRYWNRASELLYGYSSDEAVGRNLLDLIIPPEMRDGVKRAIREMSETGEAIPAGELNLMRKDGSRITVFSSRAIVRIHGREPEFFCIDVDLTERKRAELEIFRTNRALTMLSGCNEALARGYDEIELLEKICQVAVESGGYSMAWVSYPEEGGFGRFKLQAHAGREDGYLDEIEINCDPDDPGGKGPGGRCIRTGRTVVCEDLAADPSFAPWMERAETRLPWSHLSASAGRGTDFRDVVALFVGDHAAEYRGTETTGTNGG